jgi:hypothetical protein
VYSLMLKICPTRRFFRILVNVKSSGLSLCSRMMRRASRSSLGRTGVVPQFRLYQHLAVEQKKSSSATFDQTNKRREPASVRRDYE